MKNLLLLAALIGITLAGCKKPKDEGDGTSADAAKSQGAYAALGWGFAGNNASPWKMGVGSYRLPVFYWQNPTPATMPMPEHLN